MNINIDFKKHTQEEKLYKQHISKFNLEIERTINFQSKNVFCRISVSVFDNFKNEFTPSINFEVTKVEKDHYFLSLV